jgi:hypothetical protein
MDPNPDYAVTSFKFDDEFYNGASIAELSQAVTDSYKAGVAAAKADSEEKYKALAVDIQDMLGGAKVQQKA